MEHIKYQDIKHQEITQDELNQELNQELYQELEEITEPPYMKKQQFHDLMEYAKKFNYYITENFLKQYKFQKSEINWLLFYNKEALKMQHTKIKADLTNKEIVKLKKELKELKKQLSGKQKNKITNKSSNVISVRNSITLKKVNDNYVITNHTARKNNKVSKSNHTITTKDVNKMWIIINKLTTKNKPFTDYRSVVKLLLIENDIGIGIDSFNGGKNRAKYFFPLYYYPLKTLEHLGLINYGGHGKIKRLIFDEVII